MGNLFFKSFILMLGSIIMIQDAVCNNAQGRISSPNLETLEMGGQESDLELKRGLRRASYEDYNYGEFSGRRARRSCIATCINRSEKCKGQPGCVLPYQCPVICGATIGR